MLGKTKRCHSFASGYVSDFDRFLTDFMAKHPEVEESRTEGWYKYWDHNVDLDELEQQRKNSIPAKPYKYE